HVSRNRGTDQSAHGDDGDFVRVRSRAFLKQDFAETRDRFCFADPAKALKCDDHQHQVHEQTGAKRDEQKNAEATQSAIRRHTKTKLPENCRVHKRFSTGGKSEYQIDAASADFSGRTADSSSVARTEPSTSVSRKWLPTTLVRYSTNSISIGT